MAGTRLVIMIILLVPVSTCRAGNTLSAEPVRGIFDLSGAGIEDRMVISLNGQWEFYWERFLYPEDFRTDSLPEYDCIGNVPAYWSSYSDGGKTFSNTGFATYRLRVILPRGFRDTLAFDVPVFDAAFRLYINGRFMGGNGVAGTSEASSEPGYDPFIATYFPVSDTVELIIHVSNFHHRRGGFWKPMKMGRPEWIYHLEERHRLLSDISLGMLAAFSLFFLCFFILFRKDRNMLFFSLALAGVFTRIISTDSYSILIVTDVAWDWLIRMEYISTFVALIFFAWYFESLFPARAGRMLNILNTLFCGVSILAVLIFRVKIFAYTAVFLQYDVLVILLYYSVVAFVRMINKDRVAIMYLAGLIILTAAIINDILVANSQVSIAGAYMLHFAVQIFVFLHAIIVIHRWIRAFNEKEALHKEIGYINRNLERLVSERTAEIDQQNKQIARNNRQLQEALDVKNRVFSIISHDLRSPVSGLAQLFELFDQDVADDEKEQIIASSRQLVRSALDLIDNLLYWGRSQSNKIQYAPELNDLSPLISDVFRLFGEMASKKSIGMEYRPGRETRGFFDPALMGIVMRNLVSNAIKFSEEGGSVIVSVSPHPEDNKLIMITVSDTGVGLSGERINELFNNREIESTYGTANEKGIGLGLGLSLDLVRINKGELLIDSTPGAGTSIRIILPGAEQAGDL